METIEIVIIRMLIALLLGSVIGLERAYHGRLAGLRTHTLVCISSAVLMLVTVFQWDLLRDVPLQTVRIDPTRMAQGIMTGIGFLGAGVIMKEKFSIRGLTTAASIWITASIGITAGVGFYVAAITATFCTLVVLIAFAWLERKLPIHHQYGNLMIKFKRDEPIGQEELYAIIAKHGVVGSHPSFHLIEEGKFMKYELTIRTTDPVNFAKLNETLCENVQINEFRIIPMGG